MRLTILFAATGFVESMAFSHYLTFLPLLVRDLGVPASDVPGMVGLLSSAALLAGLPLVPFWGAWADRFSRKAVVVRSAVVEAVLFLLLAFVSDVNQLFLLVPLVGLVLGNTGVMLAELSERAPRARLGLAISVVGASGPLGVSIGPALGGPVVDAEGVQALFLLDAVLSAVAVGALVVGYHERPDRVRSPDTVMTLVRRSLVAVVRQPVARIVFLTYFLVLMGQRVVVPFLALYVEHLAGPLVLASTVGLVAGANGLAAAVGSAGAGALADRVGFRPVLLGAIALAAVAALVGALLGSLLPFVLDYAVLGVGIATAGAMLFAFLATELPSDVRSSVLNLSLLPMYLSGIVGSLLAVEVLARSGGDMRGLWVLGAVFLVLAMVPAGRLRGGRAVPGTLGGVRRALRLAGLAVALSLWVIAARASASAPAPTTLGPSPSALAFPGIPVLLDWETVGMMPHDPAAWIEGLLIDQQGRLFESTGIVGETTLRELDRSTGEVLRSVAPPDDVYGEGLAMAGDRLLQLTWRDGIALAWDPETFELLDSVPYAGEGWGLCSDGDRLVMSDGSATLTFRDPETFEPIGSVEVTAAGEPVVKLNELECVDGEVWSNVWETPYIVRIDPATGVVTGVLDMTGLAVPDPSASDPGAVLNGIAYDPERGTFLLTGKLWPTMYEVSITR